MLIRKTNPLGVDAVIDAIQLFLWNRLNTTFTDWESYNRAYKNPKQFEGFNVLIPEVHDQNGDYLEVFFDDRFQMTSFFITPELRSVENGVFKTDLSLIVQTNLRGLFQNVTHRADEELITSFTTQIMASRWKQYFSGIVTGINDVYAEFDKTMVKFDDMSYFHVVRFNFSDIPYSGKECCIDC